MVQTPECLIGSPMCTAFRALQGLNKSQMCPLEWNALWEKGVRHMRFAIKLYRLQAEQGRWLLHEHPISASSWKLPEMISLMEDLQTQRAVAHMCRYGMQSSDELRVGKVKKPAGFLTNSIPCSSKTSWGTDAWVDTGIYNSSEARLKPANYMQTQGDTQWNQIGTCKLRCDQGRR